MPRCKETSIEMLNVSGELLPPPVQQPAAGGETDQKTYLARYVTAGEIVNIFGEPAGIIIEQEALIAALDKFNNCAVFLDHAGWLEDPSVQHLAGTTYEACWNSETLSVNGKMRLNNTPAGALAHEIIEEILQHPDQSPNIGLSIAFYPRFAPRDNHDEDRRIIEIRHVESVDLVFQPAADGRILQKLSAFFQPIPKGEIKMPPNDSIPIEQTPTPPEPTETAAVQSAPPAVDAWMQSLASSATAAALFASGLPQASRQRLQAQFEAHPAIDPAQVNQAIEAERGFLAQLQEDSVIQIGGSPPRSPHIAGVRTSLDQIEIAMEALLSGARPLDGIPPLTGIRELYHLLSGDYEMNGVFHPDRVQFANVTSSTMANLAANVLNKRVMNEFIQYPLWWQPVVIQESFQSLQNIKWITLGGVGELPTVAEGAAYTELTWDDQGESASFVKKGGYLGITLETIDKDDTGRVRAAPRALAQAAWLTLSKSISAIFTASSGVGPTMSDSLALFHTTHANLGTTALSLTAFNAVRTAMRKQTELNSSERLGALTAPKFLLVPPDLEVTALQVLASEYQYTATLSDGLAAPINIEAEGSDFQARMQMAKSRVIVVDLWTDTTDWAASADPRLYPTIGLGFRYGSTPEIFSVASPTAGLMFTNDTMPVKVRFFFAVGPIDYRGLYKQNVA